MNTIQHIIKFLLFHSSNQSISTNKSLQTKKYVLICIGYKVVHKCQFDYTNVTKVPHIGKVQHERITTLNEEDECILNYCTL